jgi:hypothetical protein
MHLIDQQLNLMIRGRFEEAWKISEILEGQKDTFTGDTLLRHNFNRGWFLLRQGKYQEGFQLLESGRFLKVYGSGRINTNKPIWDGSTSLEGKTVLINLEAGFGDQIIYARFATEVLIRGGKTILCCHPSLHSLFSRIPGVERCIAEYDIVSTTHDFWIPGFSCSWLFGHTYDTLPNEPYITPNYKSVEMWEGFLNANVSDTRRKIGIRWGGNPEFEHQQFRIFPPKNLISMSKHQDFKFFSLQRDSDLLELPEEVIDLQHTLISWEDTAACIANLDLVITSCTSIAHLASAMGKLTWVIVPMLPYHVWANGDKHSPWYQKTTTVFRQKKFGEWDDTFTELEQELLTTFKEGK